MGKKFDVCCVGQACTDVFASHADSIEFGKMKLIEEASMSAGGCAHNVAADLAILGLNSALICKVGNDAFGEFLQKSLKESGVYIDGVVVDDSVNSSMSVGIIATDGERGLLHCPGTNNTFCFEDIDLSMIDDSQIVFFGGSLTMQAFDGEGAAKTMAYAKSKGCITAMDTNWDYTGKWLESIIPVLPYVDWFMPSIEEAEQLLGTRDQVKLADGFMKLGAKNVVIKKGAKGVYVQTADGRCFEKGVYKVVCKNASGAGDAWCAGFLTGLIKGLELEECVMLGAANASNCIVETSTTEGIKSYEETLAYMRSEPCVME